MGARTEYAPGLFCFVDLATTDLDGATGFYTRLFGWDAEAEEGYVLFSIAGKRVAGAYRHDAHRAAWNSYVSVEDVDALAERAVALGGSILAGPMDAGDAGRVAYLADPQGAAIGAWRPGQSHGAELVNEPGTLTWNDLTTSDLDAAAGFYRELFGWEVERSGLPTGVGEDGEPRQPEAPSPEGPPFAIIRAGERMNGSVLEMGGVPPAWRPHFVSADLDAGAARIEDLGGRIVIPATDFPAGRTCVAADPQGAPFSLFEGETQE